MTTRPSAGWNFQSQADMDPLIDEIKDLLKGRDFRNPRDAVILLECLSVLIDTKVRILVPPATLEAAVRRIVDEPDPEFQAHRRAWGAYLRSIPLTCVTTPGVAKN